MTVAELIEKLKTFDQDKTVVAEYAGNYDAPWPELLTLHDGREVVLVS